MIRRLPHAGQVEEAGAEKRMKGQESRRAARAVESVDVEK